jgi:hypothetical protein
VLAGSIPVILVDGLLQPFEHILDYSSFTVRMSSHSSPADIIERLRAIPEVDVQRMQRSLACVRPAFLYDENDASKRGGPVDMLLTNIAAAMSSQTAKD